MSFRPYQCKTVEWLKKAYNEAVEQMRTGGTINDSSSGSVSAKIRVEQNARDRAEEIWAELHIKDPVGFPENKKTTRTRAVFLGRL